MLILDQLRRNDRPLQIVALGILAGMSILLGGLWIVQVVLSKQYQSDLRDQTFRTVRVPALRGRILDRHGTPLADNRPSYNVNVYLEELRRNFGLEYSNHVRRAYLETHPGTKVTTPISVRLQREARYRVVSNFLFRVSSALQDPLILSEERFHKHYERQRSLPYPLLDDLNFVQVAHFVEKIPPLPGLALETQAKRIYPHGATAAHLLGYLRRDDTPDPDEDVSYQFWLPAFRGESGIEGAFDEELRGRAGAKLVLVNNMAYRQSEMIRVEPEPGRNVVLTIDLALQQAAERALAGHRPDVRGAAVILDVESGDLLAMVSSPAFDPNRFIEGFTHAEWEAAKMNDPELKPQFNRAAYARYQPGSTFKIVVALAGLEAGVIQPDAIYPSKGYFQLRFRGNRWKDTAGPGDFDFKRAFYLSSNPYFQHFGVEAGAPKIVEMGQRFKLGEPTGLVKGLEGSGYFPRPDPLVKADNSRWMDGDTANLCIGQGEVIVTPLQMAVLTAAVANGGKILQPRLVMRIEPQNPLDREDVIEFPAKQIRSDAQLNPAQLKVVQDAMLADVETREPETGRYATGYSARIQGFQVCGKTGTAQVTEGGRIKEHTAWFVSYAPYNSPRYAVVVVVQELNASGAECARISRQIYLALQKRELERNTASKPLAAASVQDSSQPMFWPPRLDSWPEPRGLRDAHGGDL